MNKINIFFTLTGYQLTWLACVLGEINFNEPKLGIYVGLIYLSLFFYYTYEKISFLKVSLIIAIPGYIFDSILVYYQVYVFNSSLILGTLPLWMFVLWMSFSTLFYKVLIFFKNYKILALILSSTLGPFTYYLGEPIGVISINNILVFFILMVIFWFLLMLYYLFYILKNS